MRYLQVFLHLTDAYTGFNEEGYPVVNLWIENGGGWDGSLKHPVKRTATTFSLPDNCLIKDKRLPMKKKSPNSGSLDFWIYITK